LRHIVYPSAKYFSLHLEADFTGGGRLNEKLMPGWMPVQEEQVKTRRTIQALGIAFALSLMTACQSANNQPQTSEATQEGAPTASQTAQTGGLRHRRAAQSGGTTQSAPTPKTISVPAGTAIHIRLSTELNTGRTASGSHFDGTLAEPLVVNGVTVAPRGSLVGGEVTSVVSSGRLKRPAEMSLVLTSITPEGGQSVPISTQTWTVSGKSHKKRDIEMVGGGAGVGALIGAIAGGGKGAAIGGAIGAAGGTGAAYATGKKEIDLPAETEMTFRLSAPAEFTVQQ
jgi:hypothetical protein